MKFSIIIPCRNAERYVRQSLLSVANQSFAPHEMIIVDDHSEDASLEIVKSSGVDVRLVHTNGLGVSGARNAGIDVAEGDWLAFLDADDIWYPNHLSRARELIGKNEVVGYINHYDYLSLNGQNFKKKPCKISLLTVGCGIEEYVDLYVKYGHFVGMSACIVERKIALEIGGFDENLARRSDIEFWLRLIYNKRWLFDPIVSSAYRKGAPNSLSSDKASAKLYRFVAFLKQQELINNSSTYDALLKRLARSALSTSYQFGTTEEQAHAHEVAYDCLSQGNKVLFNFIKLSPILGKLLGRAKWI